MLPVDFKNASRPVAPDSLWKQVMLLVNLACGKLQTHPQPHLIIPVLSEHELGGWRGFRGAPYPGSDGECCPCLIHSYKYWVRALISLHLPPSFPKHTHTHTFPWVGEPDKSKVRKTTSRYAAKRSAAPLRELCKRLSLSVARRDLACNSFCNLFLLIKPHIREDSC